jgi:uncharacterized protein YciI
MPRYLVTRVNGPGWDPTRARREQDLWDEHAEFMDGLVDDGFVVMGGPVGDGARVLLVVDAPDAAAIDLRLADDPWEPLEMLRTASVEEWKVLLDARAGPK